MPERAASVPYTPYPTEQAAGGGGTAMSAHASPEDFGAQVSKAGEDAGNKGFELVQKQQGIINETSMTNADADFATKVGAIKGKYTSLTGLSAYAAFPQYQEDIKQAFADTRANLPPMAQHGFDMMATRTMANHVADGSTYATSQLKEANRDSYSSLANSQVQALLDPDVAINKDRSDYHIDSLKYAAQAQVDENHPGLKTDPETGGVSFDESTPEGQQGKAELQQRTDSYLTQGYVNRYDTLSKMNVFKAYDEYQQERDSMPRATQVALDASFAPKIFNAHVQGGSNQVLAQASQDHANLLYNQQTDDAHTAIGVALKHEGGETPLDGATGAPAIYGINAKFHPDEFAKAKEITDSQGEDAGKKYAEDFYKKNYWDAKDIGSLPKDTQAIVMDGVINHYTGFGDKLVQAAKDGATPQQLIDMRRQEYQRLADTNPDKYAQSLSGWNARLDDLQTGKTMEGKPKSFGANPDGSPITQADYFRAHSQDVLAKGDAYAEQQMPGDLALKRAVRQTLENHMTKVISNQAGQYILDNKNVMRGINGELTKGKPPETESELRAVPGMDDLLNKVATQDPKFAEGIPTMISKMARRNDTTNSANGYSTILRTLEPNDPAEHPNRIESVDHLDKLLGRSDGTGINMKDYNDAKPLIEASQPWKDFLSKNMKEVSNANGNLDGKGQDRALAWYNQAAQIKKENDSKGEKGMSEGDLIKQIDEAQHGVKPSRMQQISNWADSIWNGKEQNIQVISSPSDPSFQNLPSGSQFKTANGQIRTKK